MGFHISFHFNVCECSPECPHWCHIHARCPRRTEESIGFSGAGVTEDCELSHADPGPLREQYKCSSFTMPNLKSKIFMDF